MINFDRLVELFGEAEAKSTVAEVLPKYEKRLADLNKKAKATGQEKALFPKIMALELIIKDIKDFLDD